MDWKLELIERGVEVTEVDVLPWGSFVFFADPDGTPGAAAATAEVGPR